MTRLIIEPLRDLRTENIIPYTNLASTSLTANIDGEHHQSTALELPQSSSMHAIAWNTFRASRKVSALQACRIVAGVRRPLFTRKFHRSAISYQAPEEPSTGTGLPVEDVQGKNENKVDEKEKDPIPDAANNQSTATEVPVSDGENPPTTRRPKTRADYGSAVNRSKRNQNSTGLPPIVLPPWFATLNVKLAGEENVKLSGKLSSGIGQKDLMANASQLEKLEDQVQEQAQHESKDKASSDEVTGETHDLSLADTKDQGHENRELPSETKDNVVEALTRFGWKRHQPQAYGLERYQLAEILAVLTADLVITPPTELEPKTIHKPTTLLLCPRDGGMFFLDTVVEEVARELHTDLLRLDSDTLAHTIGGYIGESLAWTSRQNIVGLGYQAQDRAGRLGTIDNEIEIKMSTEEEDPDKQSRPRPPAKTGEMSATARKLLPVISTALKDALVFLNPQIDASKEQPSLQKSSSKTDSEAWTDRKITTALEALLDSVTKKRKDALDTDPADSKSSLSNGLIIQVRDFKELAETSYGSSLITKLEELVKKRWLAGEKIILLGTTSSSHYMGDFSKFQVQMLQSACPDYNHLGRTIVVPPSGGRDEDKFDADEREYIRLVNIRHVADMFSQLSGHATHDVRRNLNAKFPSLLKSQKSEVEEFVWPASSVHRIATIMVGLSRYQSIALQDEDAVQPDVIYKFFKRALDLVSTSDEIKFAYMKEESKRLFDKDDTASVSKEGSTATGAAKAIRAATKERINKLKEKCDFHEKKLLAGVVYPDSILTTFSDVRAPAETIEALKTLTTLSLVRPEAFSYGVLATDKIPGLLMYGPPGTGKTMLAKAVAKESGATVLDVSGADLFNLYVGEGEKNVRALFSLAKKLTPCVVFIDEADAIFGSRGGDSSKRSSHRELINQFLREWDGMNDMSAFIMVATNRPFDLDDAVLRRLPRRLLVDLPTEKDREAILKIHLTNEVLDDSVSLAKIAKETPFYSGSDLKNVSVAAALACVREENEEAAKHTGDEPYVYPPKRTLSKRHFDKALEEISASISEDMSTLTAVRKFDEKYGDRKGRRKQRAAIGFGGGVQIDKDSEAGRVRKIKEGS